MKNSLFSKCAVFTVLRIHTSIMLLARTLGRQKRQSLKAGGQYSHSIPIRHDEFITMSR